MPEFGAFEAKNKFGHLLDLVERPRCPPAYPRPRGAEQARSFRLARMESLPGRRPSMSLVLDSSATLAWIYSDETTDAIRALFDQVADEGAVVPALWRLEVANSLTVAVRRSRIDVEFRRAALADLAHLDITTDEHTNSHAWSDTLHLADRFRLTLYDAAYLELAQRRKLPLATLDQELRAAAQAVGTKTLGEP
jgi:predicted nucleic acid-binding protein